MKKKKPVPLKKAGKRMVRRGRKTMNPCFSWLGKAMQSDDTRLGTLSLKAQAAGLQIRISFVKVPGILADEVPE